MSRIEARNVKMLGCVVAAFDHSVILEVRNLTVYPVILLMKGGGGSPVQGEESLLSIRSTVRPIRVGEADDTGVSGR